MYVDNIYALVDRFYKLAQAITFNQDAINSIMSDILNAIQTNEEKITQLTNESRELTVLKTYISYEDIRPSFKFEIPKERKEKFLEKILSETKNMTELERKTILNYYNNLLNKNEITLLVRVFPPGKKAHSSAGFLEKEIDLQISFSQAISLLKNDNETYNEIESTLVHELVHPNQFFQEKYIGASFFKNKDLEDKPEQIVHSNSVLEQEAILAQVWQELIQNLRNGIVSQELLYTLMRSERTNFSNFILKILRNCKSFTYAELYIENTDLKDLAKFLKRKFNFSKENYPTKEKFFQKFLKIGGKFVHQYNDNIIKKMIDRYHELYGVNFYEKNENIEKIERLKSFPKIEQILSGNFNIMEESAKRQANIDSKFRIIKNFIIGNNIENKVKIKVEDVPSEVVAAIMNISTETGGDLKPLKYLSFDFIKEEDSIAIIFYNENHKIFDAINIP